MEYPFIKVKVKRAFYPAVKGYVELADNAIIPIMHINAIEDSKIVKEGRPVKGTFIRLNTGIQYEVEESFDELWNMLHNYITKDATNEEEVTCNPHR